MTLTTSEHTQCHTEPLNDSLHENIELISDLLASRLSDGAKTSEFDLIRWLQEPSQAVFNSNALQDSLILFRTHFIVTHCLYRLRQRWYNEQRGWLEISAVSVQLLPITNSPVDQAITEHDALAAYYLNLKELNTEREQVEELLNDFWQRMVIPEYREADLILLELSEEQTVNKHTIRQQYRRLAMTHHPDRGGNPEHFREITAAYQRLRNGR